MQLNLAFIDSFESEFNGATYKIYQFIDPKSLTIISGTNLELKGKLEQWKIYSCTIDLRRNKLKVISVSQ